MRDVYPQQAKHRRRLETRLLRFFEDRGFEQVSCGLLEYVDTLLRSRSAGEAEDWFRLFDATGRTVALRPEMTPSIARMAAPLLAAGTAEIRWCYAERVYRRTTDPATLSWASGKAAESTQVGVEWIGRTGCTADAELLALCQQAADAVGLADWQMVVGHASFAPAFLASLGLAQAHVEQVMQCLARGDYVAARWQLRAGGVAEDALSWLAALNPLQAEAVPEVVRPYLADSVVAGCWEELVSLARVLAEQGLTDHLSFDLTLARDLTYYTGIVLELFAPGVGAPVALGGRYDDLLGQFGAPAPAIGFTFEAERLLTALTEGAWLHEPEGEEREC
ncbi:MAG: ATP phosphoribosyltransferase regulatory subunit [Alicyclobacillus sp.]|nr:ATP phosphoribosyltransferase regulatory subunit [Alicyclobacillus sp.]